MMQLVASILALGVGPILDTTSRPGGPARAALDAFTFVAMLGLILGNIIPEAFARAGWMALGVAVLASFGPTFFEQRIRGLAERAHSAAIALGATGLIVHGTFDGMALVDLGGNSGWNALAIGVVLHRVPAGLTLWWLFRPRYGRLRAQLILAGLAVTTVAGFIGAESLKGRVTESQEGLFMALVGGALLHVVMHRTGHATRQEQNTLRRQGALVGAVLGAVLLYWMSEAGGHFHPGIQEGLDEHVHGGGTHTGAFIEAFHTLLRESAPALVIAFTMAGLIQVFLPKSSVRWMARGGHFKQALKGMIFGLPLPICSCGVVPVYRSLATRGVPVAAGLAFLVATPELGIDAVLLSMPLLGSRMTIVRVVAAALVALFTAWMIARLKVDSGNSREADDIEELESEEELSLLAAAKIGWVKFFDSTAPWIVMGLVIAAVAQPLLPVGAFDGIPHWLQVPLFAVIGMPLYVCASAATPIVAVLLIKGVSPGAALAFLLTGPATNVTTFGLLKSLHGRKLALTFVAAIIATTVSLGWISNGILGEDFKPETTQNLTEEESTHIEGTHDHAAEGPGVEVADAALWILVAAFLMSLYRQGPQGFMSHVFSQTADGDEEHDDHNHGGGSCCGGPPPEDPKPGCCQG